MENDGSGRLDGGLWLVSTPIGNARDITLRALDVLGQAEVLAAEDTRALRRLMEIHGIALAGRRILAYHDHSRPHERERLLAPLREGRALAYASEAGTPLIADPGYRLVQAAAQEGIPVRAVPGPSAAVAALTLAGLPTDRFLFAGFAPARSAERRAWLQDLAPVRATLVIYESPRRVRELFADCVPILGADRQAALCRELTKRFEEVRRGTLAELAADPGLDALRGEVVVVIDRGPEDTGQEAGLEEALRAAMAGMSVRDAAESVATARGLPRRVVYQTALRLARDD